MKELLKHTPDRKLTRSILVLGLMIFIPVYSYIVRLFGQMGIETSVFNEVWISFDAKAFETFFRNISDRGQLETFVWTFNLNLISMTGFMLLFFALSLMVARQIPETSRLAKTAFSFPWIALGIGVLDIIPTIVFLFAASSIPNLSNGVVNIISGGYMIRVILLYGLLLWMIISGVVIFKSRIKKAKA